MDSDKAEKLTSSEIGQYVYCPVGWLLQRDGTKPDEKYLKPGRSAHADLGRYIGKAEGLERLSGLLKYAGWVLLIGSILFLVWWLL